MRDYPIIERTLKVNSKGWPYWNSKDLMKALEASDHNRIQAEFRLLASKGVALNWANSVFEREKSLSFIRWPMFMYVMFLFPENEEIQRLQVYLANQTNFDYGQAIFDKQRGAKAW